MPYLLRMKLATSLLLPLTATVVLAQPVTPLGPGVNVGAPHAIATAFGALPFAHILHVSPAADGGFIVFFYDFAAIRSAHVDVEGKPDFASTRVLIQDRYAAAAVGDTAAWPVLFWSHGGITVFASVNADGSLGPTHDIPGSGPQPVFAQCDDNECYVVAPDPQYRVDGPLPPVPLRASIVRPDGSIVTNAMVNPAVFNPDFHVVALASSSSQFLVLGNTGGSLHALCVGDDGSLRFDRTIATAEYELTAAADFDGLSFNVVWSTTPDYPDTSTSVSMARLSVAGSLGPATTLYPAKSEVAMSLALAWNGAEHLLIDSPQRVNPSIGPEPTALRRSHVSFDSTLKSGPTDLTTIGQSAGLEGLASNHGVFYAAWLESHQLFDFSTIRGSIISGQLQTPPEGPVVAPVQRLPRTLASTDNGYAAIWSETDPSNNQSRLLVQRLRRDGSAIDGAALLLDESYEFLYVVSASIGDGTLIAWTRQTAATGDVRYEVGAAVLRGDGTIVAVPLPSAIGDRSFTGLSVAANRNSWLLVSAGSAVQISATGNLLTPSPVQFGPATASDTSVASDGERFLVASAEGPARGVQGVQLSLLNADATLSGPSVTLGDGYVSSISLAFNSSGYELLSGTLLQFGQLDGKVQLTRIDGNGKSLGTTNVTQSGAGAGRIVRFLDGWLATFYEGGTGPLAVRIAADGSIATTPFAWPFAVETATPTGAVGVLETQSVEIPPWGTTPQLFLREVTWTPSPRRRAF
jgi:hypothetical protein